MRRIVVGLAAIATVFAMTTVAASAGPQTSHCAGYSDEAFTKVEGQGAFTVGTLVIVVDGPSVTFTDGEGSPVTAEFCVKAATGISGTVSGSSFTVNWLNGGGQTPDISYVILYGGGDDEEDPCVIDPEGCLA